MSSLSINKNVELKSGIEWIKASFYILRENPLQFIVLGIFSTIISLMPVFGAFMTPLFIGKFAGLTAKVEQHEAIPFSSIFNGLFNNKTLVRLAFLNFCINTIILTLQYVVETILKQRNIEVGTLGNGIMIAFLIPVILLQIAMWLSPVICLYNEDIRPLQAMLLSIKVCFYNLATLFLYSLMVIVFTIVAIIPVGLGLLIWLPMLNIVTYFIYKSVLSKQ